MTLSAAVYREGDPRAAGAARVIPKRAELLTVGGAVLGYELQAGTKLERQFSLSLLRLREIETVIRSRHGLYVPDPTDTDDRPLCLGYGHAVSSSVPSQDLWHWSRRWAPWLEPSEIVLIQAAQAWRRDMAGADEVAAMMFVHLAERRALGLRTIGAVDIAADARKAAARLAKLERDRHRQAEKRRAEGRLDREAYLAGALSTQRPWEAMGISRRQYERRVKKVDVASVSRLELSNSRNGDTLATCDLTEDERWAA